MTILHGIEQTKAIEFAHTRVTVTCTIHVEDGCMVTYKHIRDLTKDDYIESKVAAYNGALDLFNRLQGVYNDSTTKNEAHAEPLTEVANAIYNYIEMNEFNAGLLMSHIKNLATTMNITGALTRLSPMFIPRLMLGRQVGHTTAIRRFIENNPKMKIGIVTKSTSFINSYGRGLHSNVFNIISGTKPIGYTDDNLRSVTLDYIIFDSIGMHGLDIHALERVLYTSSTNDETRIIGLGN